MDARPPFTQGRYEGGADAYIGQNSRYVLNQARNLRTLIRVMYTVHINKKNAPRLLRPRHPHS